MNDAKQSLQEDIHELLMEQSKATFRENAYGKRHYMAFTAPKMGTAEIAIVQLIRAAIGYIDAHERAYEVDGLCYVLGPGMKSILQGIRVLLCGEVGRLDSGFLDTILFKIAERAGVDLES